MSDAERKNVAELSAIKSFHLPRYAELPNFGLYLEQALGVINDALSPVISEPITKPMMNTRGVRGAVVSSPAGAVRVVWGIEIRFLCLLCIL